MTTRRDPTLSATTAAMGVKTAATIANGRVCRPAESVEYPLTNWKYWVIRKMNPKRQKNATEMESAPPLNRGILNTRTSSSGPSVRNSSSVKTVNSTAATVKHTRVPVDAQPHCGPSMMPSTNEVTPTVEITTPRMSKGCSATLGSRGISIWPAMSVTMTIGTFTRKIDPYQKCSSSAPPVIGPKATAIPDVAPQMPRAFCRSDGSGKTLVRMARLAGKMKAAATPISARLVIRVPVVCDAAAAAEKSPKNTRPTCMVPLRPRRSPIPPPASSKPAKARL